MNQCIKKQEIVFTLILSLVICAFSGVAGATDRIEYEYRRAQSSLERLQKSRQKQKYRHNWLGCIDKFKAVYSAQPNGRWADDAIFMVGRLYSQLYRHSYAKKDKVESLDYFNRLLKRFPKSPYRAKASRAIAQLQGRKPTGKKTAQKTVHVKKGLSKSKTGRQSKKSLAKPKEKKTGTPLLAEVTDLRIWSNPDYTRVVVDVDQEVKYKQRLLKKDPSIGKPQRLYIDVTPARIGSSVKPVVPVGDDLLSDARAAQYLPDTVRVVLDIKSIDKFKIFSLKNPFRVVLDVNGIPKKKAPERVSKKQPLKPGTSIPKGSLAKQLALGVRRIVIDPGHGGKDPGALGYQKGILEKNVTLEVSKRLARKIRDKLGIEAVLTRDRDVFLSLEERTAIANTKNGDLFLSIHANANRNKRMRGIETYFLNLATDNDAIMVAARENATSAKNISDLETILNDLMKNAKINESSRLATHVQRGMAKNLRKRFKDVRDHGVKQAPFYVLLGAEMPCVLVEIAFISNPTECRRLNTSGYQEALADAITEGIKGYIEEMSPTAFQQPNLPQIQARR
jgi:N-acetylmuramoyl-L-alanine amidase